MKTESQGRQEGCRLSRSSDALGLKGRGHGDLRLGTPTGLRARWMNLRSGIVLGFLLAACVEFQGRVRAEEADGTGGAGTQLLKTDLMGIFAHPDDETGVASILAHYALGEGRPVACIYATRGEGGGNMVGTQAGAALGILRERELRDCLAQLGVRHVGFLDRLDFAYTENLSVTLDRWGHEASLERLVRWIRTLRPEVILTMNPAPVPGQHGHHQAAGWLAVEAFSAAGDPERFADQIRKEGLAAWQPRKLYFGGAGPAMVTVDVTRPLPDGRLPWRVAGQALSEHRSQGFGRMAEATWLARPGTLQLVKSVVPFHAEETDLFRGLPVTGDCPERRYPHEPPLGFVGQTPGPIRFLPRRAVERYLDFVRAQAIGHTVVRWEADIPVVRGEASPVPLEILETVDTPRGSLRIEVPEGWTVKPARIEFGKGVPRGYLYRILEVTPPADGGEGVIRAVGQVGEEPVEVSARLVTLPRWTARRVAPGDLALDDSSSRQQAAWDSLAWVRIGPEMSWQGQARDAADCSGRFRVAHDGRDLWLEVEVMDDLVVSNIAADDIRGHWRSDSIEVCVDPTADAEHTLEAFKVGVFPFDAEGRVRGARDADARPGLIEETAPGMALRSRRTETGYRVRMRIPLGLMEVDLNRSRRLGFNVLLYDGDKVDAAPGENINRTRLAWSPRSGVQGRPEDWGRLDLE